MSSEKSNYDPSTSWGKEGRKCVFAVRQIKDFLFPQLPGGLFSPCDKWKQLSPPMLLYFPFCVGT